jgi:hypothetical protein
MFYEISTWPTEKSDHPSKIRTDETGRKGPEFEPPPGGWAAGRRRRRSVLDTEVRIFPAFAAAASNSSLEKIKIYIQTVCFGVWNSL